jgi:uncharacterized cupin superfamily protein
MSIPNVFGAEFRYDDDDPPGFHAAVAEVGKAAGGKELSVRLFEVPPGQALCPYHYEYVEEWLIVLEGDGVAVRTKDGERRYAPGDVVCFPSGPDGVHQALNRGAETARILMFSSAQLPAVAVYPDSDKVGVWTSNDADEFMFRRAEGKVDYWDGEPERGEAGSS